MRIPGLRMLIGVLLLATCGVATRPEPTYLSNPTPAKAASSRALRLAFCIRR
jgi:hypothetical protein